jgi:hypothetical protein
MALKEYPPGQAFSDVIGRTFEAAIQPYLKQALAQS